MAGRGPAPKETLSRARASSARQAEMTELEATGELYGEPLPDDLLDGESWHPETLRFWDALRRNPLLADETEISWSFLRDTALMHHTMWTKRKWEFAAELRLRYSKYGATPEDRMRLKIKIRTPLDEQKAPPSASNTKVSDIASRRARLSG